MALESHQIKPITLRGEDARLFAVLAEHVADTALVMEAEDLSYEEATKRADKLRRSGSFHRVAIVRLEFEEGNRDLFEAKQMQTWFRKNVLGKGTGDEGPF